MLGPSIRTVYRLVWAGELRALRSGRRVLIQPSAVEEYLSGLAAVAAR